MPFSRDNELLVPYWRQEIESLLMIERTDTGHGYRMREHVHQYYELLFNYYPVSLRHTVAGQPHDTDSPFILFRAPYILHATCALDEREYTRTSIGFHPCVLTECGGLCKLGRLASCWECVIPTTTEKIRELEPLIIRLRRVRDPSVPKYVWLSTLATLLYEVSEMADNAVIHETAAAPYVQEVLRYVVEHAEEELRIDTIADRFFVSRAKLTRDFRAAVNMSLHQYITEIRIHRAKILLTENLPLAMVAQQCGFSSDSSFVYMFRRHTGTTPGEYRRNGEG